MADENIVMEAPTAPVSAPVTAPAATGLEGVSEPVAPPEVEGEKPAADAAPDPAAEGTTETAPAGGEADIYFDETLPFDKEMQGKFHSAFGDEALVLLPQVAVTQELVKEFGGVPNVEAVKSMVEAQSFLGELASNLESNPAAAVESLLFNKVPAADGSMVNEMSTEGHKLALGFAEIVPNLPPGPAFNRIANHFVGLLHQGALREEQAAQQRVDRARSQGFESEAKTHELAKLTHEVVRQEMERIMGGLGGAKGQAQEPPDIKAARERLEADKRAFEESKQQKIQAEVDGRLNEANTILTGVYSATVETEMQKIKDKVPVAIFNAISRDLASVVDTEFKKGAGNLVQPRILEFSRTGDRAKLEQAKGTYRAKVAAIVAQHAPKLIKEYAPQIQLVDQTAQAKVAAAAQKVGVPNGAGGVSGGSSDIKRMPGESHDAFVKRVVNRQV